MAGSVKTKYNLRQLYNLVHAMTDKHVVQVGIFGNKNPRGVAIKKVSKHIVPKYGGTGDTLTNSEVGAIHEFGSFSRKIPARSFLRMPIHTKSKEIMTQASRGMKQLIADGKMLVVLKRLGIACENAIQKAFASRGFGTWAPDKHATIKRKGSSAPLIDTAQLRRSITSRVVQP